MSSIINKALDKLRVKYKNVFSKVSYIQFENQNQAYGGNNYEHRGIRVCR